MEEQGLILNTGNTVEVEVWVECASSWCDYPGFQSHLLLKLKQLQLPSSCQQFNCPGVDCNLRQEQDRSSSIICLRSWNGCNKESLFLEKDQRIFIPILWTVSPLRSPAAGWLSSWFKLVMLVMRICKWICLWLCLSDRSWLILIIHPWPGYYYSRF